MRRRLRAATVLAGLLVAQAGLAQDTVREEPRILEQDGGARVEYTLRVHPAGAHLPQAGAALAPDSALNTAKLLNLHLSTGDLDEAAGLSNSPRRRFEVLRDYRDSVGIEEFKRVFAQYLQPENRLVAEVVIGTHRLLVWELKDAVPGKAPHLAGQYFVDVEGRTLVDDVPSETRTRLRRVLEAYRAGKLPGS